MWVTAVTIVFSTTDKFLLFLNSSPAHRFPRDSAKMAPGLNLPPPTAGAGPSAAAPSKQAKVEDVDDSPSTSNAASMASGSQAQPAVVHVNRFATGGIIYPPPDIRTVVDRTASFVARLGKQFEDKMRSEDTSGKLSFLKEDDPYHAYYLHALENGGTATEAQGATGPTDGGQAGVAEEVQGDQAKGDADKLDEPEPFLFSAEMPSTTAIDLDIVKLAALFTAARGRGFASEILAKEAQSFQFEFLRPTHSLFPFFNRLVEQYQLVMEAPDEIQRSLEMKADAEDGIEGQVPRRGAGTGGHRSRLLADLQRRTKWEQRLKDTKRKQEDEEAEQRGESAVICEVSAPDWAHAYPSSAAFDEIDWQDFVVVQTVEINDNDMHIDLPLPLSIRDVEGMSMAQKKLASMIMDGADDGEEAVAAPAPTTIGADDEDTMDMESEDEAETSHAAVAPPPVAAPAPSRPAASSDMKIRKNYVPKALAQRQQTEATTACPVCGQQVPLKEMDEHVRIELLNPQYRDQRRELEAKQAQHRALQSGADPVAALRQYAGARTDIFGAEGDEKARMQREEEERRQARERERVIYDGHLASKATTLERAQKLAMSSEASRAREASQKQANLPSIGPQIGRSEPAAVPTAPTDAPKRPADGPPAGEPAAQRQALDSSTASASAAARPASSGPGPKLLSIQLPDASNLSSFCDGRQVSLEPLPMSTTMSQIRDIVHDDLLQSSIGASRIKLKVAGKPVTLKQTIASLELGDGALVEVSIK